MADQVQTNPGAESARPPMLPPASPTVAERPQRGTGGSPFTPLKPGQGIHVRWASAVGAGVLAVSCAHFIWTKIVLIGIVERNVALRAAIPVVVLVALCWLIFWLVARQPKVVDFLIATEGEMKKVNWSSRREVWGATKVVIFTVLSLAFLLFIVDMAFIFFFSSIGVLKLNVMSELTKTGA